MSRALTVSRTSLGLSPLALWDPPIYVLPEGGFSPGQQTWRRTSVESPWVAGSFLTAAVKGQASATIVVHCQGDTGGQLRVAVEQLLEAVGQFDYRIDWQYDGVVGAWRCEPADYQVGAAGPLDEEWLHHFGQQVSLTIPHSPIPLLGRI